MVHRYLLTPSPCCGEKPRFTQIGSSTSSSGPQKWSQPTSANKSLRAVKPSSGQRLLRFKNPFKRDHQIRHASKVPIASGQM